MSSRIRHCVQCPRCQTRYLLAASPYRNGSYLVSSSRHSIDEYTLYCSCQTPAVSSRCTSGEIRPCEVSKEAHRRGYGDADEITALKPAGASWTFNIDQYLNPRSSNKWRNSP